MMKLVAAMTAFVALALPLAAQTQPVTKVGVCDFTKVLLTAYKDTKPLRDLDQARNDYNKEIASVTKQISDLQNQKLDADKAADKSLSASLDASITARMKYLNDYRTVRGTWLTQQQNALLTGPVLDQILDVLQYVSETGGYSLILRSDGGYQGLFLIRIPEIDITDDVIKEIQNRQAKAAGG